jgi:hypothetical protein
LTPRQPFASVPYAMKADSVKDGSVGIGMTNPGYKLYVHGSVAGVGNYNNLSDGRYKTHVATVSDALDTILNLRGVTFD